MTAKEQMSEWYEKQQQKKKNPIDETPSDVVILNEDRTIKMFSLWRNVTRDRGLRLAEKIEKEQGVQCAVIDRGSKTLGDIIK